MSLRLRLLLSLLALSAVGLVVVDAVSYSSLRSHLSQRVDQQVESARGAATVALFSEPGAKKLRRSAAFGRGFAVPLPQGQAGLGPGGGLQPGPPPGGGDEPGPPLAGGPPESFELPPGTYAVLRDAKGRTVSHVGFSYGEEGLPAPVIPDDFPVSAPGGPAETFTVDARTDDDGGFRATAFHPAGSSLTAIVAVPLSDFQDTLNHVALIGLLVTAAVLIGLAVLAWWLIRLGLRPLEEMGETAGRIAAGDLTQRVEETNPDTEVGQLGLSLNAMLVQIEEAFAQREASEMRMRRFLADASHELRTPLTSIRGYSEVFRLGAAADPAELETAMRRIEQESVRMSGMVNDLMALARLDELREPIRELVDLRGLVSDACDDARAVAPDREISLTGPPEVEILGDPDQLRRVAANLLANAIGHTPESSPIEVALEVRDGEAVLSVRDHGPGIADGANDKVFERFWRASESRGRDGGAGLGLAIVAGVADAHGGSVSVVNDPGGGARFTVRLPMAVPHAAAR
jgi:two-component system OmpR family sensor kinase